MDNLIISKKGKAPAFYSIGGILIFIFSALSFYTSFEPRFGYEVEMHEIISFAAPFILLVVSCALFSSAARHNKAYIKIYSDHIEGCGVCGKFGTRAQNFSFALSDSYTVTREGNFICVNCSGNTYYISFSPSDANAVYFAAVNKHYSGSVNQSQVSAPEKSYSGSMHSNPPKTNYSAPAPEQVKIFECPMCKAKCSIPAVSGKIKINCPKCNNSFVVEN